MKTTLRRRPGRAAANFLVVVAAVLSSSFLAACNECRRDGDCDDGIFCNGAETCRAGGCVFGTPRDCSDAISCTTDLCDEASMSCFHEVVDRDGDGHLEPGCGGDDCDDTEATVFAGAPEQCDGLDNDCDGVVAEDRDGDGSWSSEVCPSFEGACGRNFDPEACLAAGGDCDDEDPHVHPGAPEPCDGIDQNCVDGIDDEADTDGDGFIDRTCAGGDDCNDESAYESPATPEECNGEDDNCDGWIDEGFECSRFDSKPCTTLCGTEGSVRCTDECEYPPLPESCEPPLEECNGVDDDCDGEVDEDQWCVPGEIVECTTSCGSQGVGVCTNQCEGPSGEDCEPPEEECNGIDDDCDRRIDEDIDEPGEGYCGAAVCIDGEWIECREGPDCL